MGGSFGAKAGGGVSSLFDLFQRGGPVMWPILFCSIAALAITMERWMVLSRIETETNRLLAELKKDMQTRQLAQAERHCDKSFSPLAKIMKSGLRRYGEPRAQVREILEESGSRQVLALQQYLPLLGTIAHLAPLLGLLGTVTGLVRCFQVIQEKSTSINPVNPGDLAGGIWEALLTTVFGLLVAIPAYAMYNFLIHRVHHLVNALESSASELTDFLAGEGSPPIPSWEKTHAI